MPFEIHVAEDLIRKELRDLGYKEFGVSIEVIDASTDTYSVTIIAEQFEGQTYLDRELHIRPAIARAFAKLERPRANYVVDVLTPAETEAEAIESIPEVKTLEVPASEEEREGKREWRLRIAQALDALDKSNFHVSMLEQNLYSVTRNQLNEQKTLIAFALSPRATAVDYGLRRAMQTARQAERYGIFYYVTPIKLENPFSNQSEPDWLKVVTTTEFLHTLNGSVALAEALIREYEAEAKLVPVSVQGEVVEPEIKTADGSRKTDEFYDYVRGWSRISAPSLLLLMAPAGHGKTTLARELTKRLSYEFVANPEEAVIPLLVPFKEIRRTVDFEGLLHKRLAELRAGTYGAFAQLLAMGRAVLLIDGFDELADDAGFEVAEVQVRSMKPLINGTAKVLLAGRSVFTQHFAGDSSITDRVRSLLGEIDVQTLEILPFSPGQVRQFISTRKALSQENRQKVMDFAQATPDHEDICSNPLFLRIVCGLADGGTMPAAGEVVAGVNALIDKVCEREEQRHALGLGAAGQLRFLSELAGEVFKTGGVSVPAEDVRIIAKMIADEARLGPEGVGRLLDHAFLSVVEKGRLGFTHPFIRDVILGRALVVAAAEGRLTTLGEPIAFRDLPEGTIRHVAREGAKFFHTIHADWLWDPAAYRSQVRRNLLRIAVAASRFKTEGNPRVWLEGNWAKIRRLVEIDVSGLTVESVSFDEMSIEGCDLSATFVNDCDFRTTIFRGCKMSRATFADCRTNARSKVDGGVISECEVWNGKSVIRPASGDDLVASMKVYEDEGKRRVTKDVLHDVRELTRAVLERFAVRTSEGAPIRFHEVAKDDLYFQTGDHTTQHALTKVVMPRIRAKLCDRILVAGSREKYSISKRWQSAVEEFLRTGRATPGMQEILASVAAKAARYLSE